MGPHCSALRHFGEIGGEVLELWSSGLLHLWFFRVLLGGPLEPLHLPCLCFMKEILVLRLGVQC